VGSAGFAHTKWVEKYPQKRNVIQGTAVFVSMNSVENGSWEKRERESLHDDQGWGKYKCPACMWLRGVEWDCHVLYGRTRAKRTPNFGEVNTN